MSDRLVLNRYQQLWLALLLALGSMFLLTELHISIALSFGVTLIARAGLSLGFWQTIYRWQKVVLVGGSLGLIKVSYDSMYSLDAMVSLLLLMWALKFLETQRRRDSLVLILLNFFVMFSQLLYSQTLLSVSLVVINAVLSLAVLAIQYSRRPSAAFRYSAQTTIISLFLASLMFVIMPRTGALWTIPLARDNAVTGLSDRVSPGDIASLVNSNKTAFRVSLENGSYPEPRERYWRAIVLDYFDGRAWQRGRRVVEGLVSQGVECEPGGDAYRVMVEPNFMPWLFQLQGTDTLTPDLERYTNQTIKAPSPVGQRMEYQLCDSVASSMTTLTQDQRDYYLWIPSGSNPRALEWAGNLADTSDEQKVRAVLEHFNQHATYTRSPALLGEHSVDEFLFDSPRGFCEHFASSFSFLMRASGVPSRVVVGYQGGEISEYADYMRVSQRDAHAWSEIFIEGRGWIQVDPTAYVAPDRIEVGFDAPSSAAGWNFDAAWYDVIHSSAIKQMVLRLDAINYQFATWVGSFDARQRENFLREAFGEHIILKSITVLFGSFLFILLLAQGVTRWRTRVRYDGPTKRYLKAEQKYAKLGFVRASGETPKAFLQRVSLAIPEESSELAAAVEVYYLAKY